MVSLFLHAGFHKTGTSAIQQYAARRRSNLKAGGILYPYLWPATFRPVSAHHFLAHAVAGDERLVALRKVRSLIAGWRQWAEQTGGWVLLSSEAICRHQLGDALETLERQRAYLERLAEVLDGFNVEPVLVIRRQDEFVRSLYQEHVATGLGASARLSFPDFLLQFAAGKACYLDRIRLFRDVFGKVRVLVYEDLADRNLPEAFFEQLGLEVGGGKKSVPVRESLSAGQTLVKQRLNEWVNSRRRNRLLLSWLCQGRIKRVIDDELGRCVSLWPDAATRRRFMAQFDEENAIIAREFLRRDGKLFPPLEDSRLDSAGCCHSQQVTATVQRVVRAGQWGLRIILGKNVVNELLRITR